MQIVRDGNFRNLNTSYINGMRTSALISSITESQLNTQQGDKLVGSGYSGSDIFQGYSVSLSQDGDTLAIGGNGDSGSIGATWIFNRITQNGVTRWVQTGNKLVGSGHVGQCNQGNGVSLSGDATTLAIGGPYDNTEVGAVWIFVKTIQSGNIVWTQQGSKLVANDVSQYPYFGWSVSLSQDGNTLAASAPYDVISGVETGSTFIFNRNKLGVWSQTTKLVGSGNIGASYQGWSISLNPLATVLSVGGYGDNNSLGATWVFSLINNQWIQTAKIVASDSSLEAFQGISVSLNTEGDILAIGGYEDSGNLGATWIFKNTSTNPASPNWMQIGSKIIGNNAIGSAHQGYSVSLNGDGNILVIGSYSDNSGIGAFYLYKYNEQKNIYIQSGSKLFGSGYTGSPNQGISVCINQDSSTISIGGYNDNSNVGATWIFN